MTAIAALLFQADAKEGFLIAIGPDIGAFMQALALGQPLLVGIALIEAKIIEDAFILAAIERAKDRLAALQVLTVENGQRIPVQLFRAFEHRRKSGRRLFKLIRRFRLNRRETIARDAINILGTERDRSGLDLARWAGIFMMLGDAGS